MNKTREAAACAQANCASSFTNATNAATSATNAAASAAAAAASAEIAGIYLGAKSVAPTTDNEGGPLQEGMLYFNTVSNGLFVWNGSAWASADFNEFTNFTATGTTTARNLVTRFSDVVNVKDFGAVGDGVTDDTAAIQAAINSGAKTITGVFGTYLVTTIYPKSNQVIRDFNLIEKGSATTINFRPVIKIGGIIGGVVQTVTNLVLENINIDGNRSNLQSIDVLSGEDGGMHGFNIADGSTNIKIYNCQANYCGTAGLIIHSETTGSATYPIKNIYIDNFIATYNRQHGIFCDAFDSVYMTSIVSSNNGQTIAAGYPDTNGNTAFKNAGVPYGSGIDLECYIGNAKSYFKNFYADGMICRNNATECMIYAPPVVNAVVEIPAENIFFKDVYFEKGTNAGSTIGFTMYANTFVGSKYGIDTVNLSGFIDGYINSNNVKSFSFTDGFIKTPSSINEKALFNNGLDSVITVPSNRDSIKIQTLGVPAIVTNTGVGVISTYIDQLVKSNGKHSLVMPFSVSGGLISGGNMSWTITLPSTIQKISNVVINSWNTTSGKSVISNVQISSSNSVRVYVTPTDDTIDGNIEVEVLF